MVLTKFRAWMARKKYAREMAKLAKEEYAKAKPALEESIDHVAAAIRKEGKVLKAEATSETLRLAEEALKEAERKLEEVKKKVYADAQKIPVKGKKTKAAKKAKKRK